MKNPFRIRASQRSVNDEEFVRLFGSSVLEILREIENPWDGIVFLRSAPGGGKTSLLRLLTPRALKLTRRLYDYDQVKSTRQSLRANGAVSNTESEIFGTMVIFTSEYRELAEFDRGNSLFRELVNSRIVIAVLRTLLARSERIYPKDLHTIKTEWEPESDTTIPSRANGRELFEWASKIENGFYERMDNLGEPEPITGGHPRLDSLQWFARAKFHDATGPVHEKRVLLFDEVQNLSRNQRTAFIEYLMGPRENCGIWVAERLEALSHKELLLEGALPHRDYEHVIQLEQRWKKSRGRTYARFVEQIADLRAAKIEGFRERDFSSCLADEDDKSIWEPEFKKACTEIQNRIHHKITASKRYDEWIKKAACFEGTPWQKALEWRKTEVAVDRDLGKASAEFSFVSLRSDEFDAQSQAIERAAEHFLRTEIKAPIYFGRDALASVSSWNVDQYLEVAGELFAEIMAKSSSMRNQSIELSTDRQDTIIRQVAKIRWDSLDRRLPRGAAVRRFLMSMRDYCRKETFRPNAPYPPGVTGIALKMTERESLIESHESGIAHQSALREILTSLLAHNLLVPFLDHQQGGDQYVVFYLNRLLCVHFGLPLGRGGWRHISLPELDKWRNIDPMDISVESNRDLGLR